MKKKRFSAAGKRHVSCDCKADQGVPVSVGVTVKPKRFLLTAFCILLAPYCLLLLTSCKDVGVPPDRIISDTTDHGPDTTSHNFIWTIDTLGDGGASSELNDVTIINDTLAYAVGEIYLKDSSGQIDPQFYNLAIWNGANWSLERVFYFYQGQPFLHPFKAVFAIAANNVWFCGNGVMKWNGTHFIEVPIPPSVWGSYWMNKMWASENNLYVVGDGGSIAHFDGSTWTKIESGTTLGFTDLWGASSPGSNSPFVVAVASDFNHVHRVMTLLPSSARDTLGWTQDRIPFSCWFTTEPPYYVGGEGLWEYNGQWTRIDSLTLFKRIRGSAKNNLFAFGGGMQTFLKHYNGSTWKEYPEVRLAFSLAEGLSVSTNMVMAVASNGNFAFVIRGIRQQ